MSNVTDTEYLRERYGSRTSDKRLVWIVGGIAVVFAAAWLVWQAIALSNPTLLVEEAALNITSDSSISVTFNVTADAGSFVSCTVRAYTDATKEVGVKEVTVGPLSETTASVTVEVATIQPATGARVTDCRFVTQ